jgi:hypothetical protein
MSNTVFNIKGRIQAVGTQGKRDEENVWGWATGSKRNKE